MSRSSERAVCSATLRYCGYDKTPKNDPTRAAHGCRRRRTAELIAECLSARIELSAVAAATGLTPSGTRSRLRADPSNPDAWPATRARVEAAAAKRGQPRTRAPLPPAPAGFARMTEAAVALNLSRSGIYYKIDAGELTTKTIDGHRYVKMPKESPKR